MMEDVAQAGLDSPSAEAPHPGSGAGALHSKLEARICVCLSVVPAAARADGSNAVRDDLVDTPTQTCPALRCQTCRDTAAAFCCALESAREFAQDYVWTRQGLKSHEGDGGCGFEAYEDPAVPEGVVAHVALAAS